MKNDKMFLLRVGSVKLDPESVYDRKIRIIESGLMKKLDFRALTDFYREKRNQFAAGEFFGKIIRAACVLFAYTGNEELYTKIKTAVYDLIGVQGEDGEISTAPKNEQPNGSSGADLWERKYVMLGLLEYYGISNDENAKTALVKLLDYTISQVGAENGKTDILDTGWAFYGIESSSILEPVVKIYRISGEKRHLDFASYIVDRGFCKRENVIDAVLSGKSPFMIGDNGEPRESIAKAYEMMSCFEGLIEYYRITEKEKYKTAALKLYEKLVSEEITELGSGGADRPYNLGPGTGEQWNRTKYEQANPDIELMMETCVTVTWMKLCLQLLRLYGDSRFADKIEVSAVNALCAALRPDGMFYEYFPKFNGKRNPKVNFSYKVGGFDLSCCTANGPMGAALVPFTAFMRTEKFPVINMYVNGSASFGNMTVKTKTEFPQKSGVTVLIKNVKESTPILFRKAEYAYNFRFGSECDITVTESAEYQGYYMIDGDFSHGAVIRIDFDVKDSIVVSDGSVNPEGNGKLLLKHGPVVLSRDKRYTDITGRVKFSADPRLEFSTHGPGELVKAEYCGYTWIDYQSAGASWDEESDFITWNERA